MLVRYARETLEWRGKYNTLSRQANTYLETMQDYAERIGTLEGLVLLADELRTEIKYPNAAVSINCACDDYDGARKLVDIKVQNHTVGTGNSEYDV